MSSIVDMSFQISQKSCHWLNIEAAILYTYVISVLFPIQTLDKSKLLLLFKS